MKAGASIPVLVAVAALSAGVVSLAYLETKATIAGHQAAAAQKNAHDAAERLREAKLARALDSISANIRRLGRGMIRDAQAREMAETMRRLCTAEVTPELVLRLIHRESRFNPSAIGRQGEIGLCQVKPSTVRIPADELRDPVRNVEAGILHLRALVATTGEVGLALAAWNAGLYSPAVKYAINVKGGERGRT